MSSGISLEGTLPGIPLSWLSWDISFAQPEFPAQRFYLHYPKEVERTLGNRDSLEHHWDHYWRYVPMDRMQVVFTVPEILFLWEGSFIQSDVERYMYSCIEAEYTPETVNWHLIWKIGHSLHMWGRPQEKDRPDRIFRVYRGMGRLNFGEGFEVRLDHTSAINERGTAVYASPIRSGQFKPVWLDGEFGLLVYHKGKHVLTVGFSATDAGILIHQVQLREEKGNRFLYRLPAPYLEHTIRCFQSAFDLPVLLIRGAEAVHRIKLSYGKDKRVFLTSGAPERIQAFYDQELPGFVRNPPVGNVYADCAQISCRCNTGS